MMNSATCTRVCRGLWLSAWLLLAACSSDPDAAPTPSFPVPFAARGDHLAVWDGTTYQPMFVKGINLGVAVPGTQPGELAATREQYDRWLAQIGALGFNTLRSYTLHYPRFYQALADYNMKHPEAPLYLLSGVWLDEENASGDLFDTTEGFEAAIREAVDCAHGECSIPEQRGRAHGEYRTDISPWILGYIIGRELAPAEVAQTNAMHPEVTSYLGTAISLPSGTPLEAWFAERLDGLVTYERMRYGVERPVSVSNWPTLDPLRHLSESLTSGEDSQAIDLENINTTGAPAGYFASYHAYPYYPDFMTRDPRYRDARDRFGANSFHGYLAQLKQHYATHPLVIAEFGVPTSWGNAHFGAAGMNHGGQTETEQGEHAARLLTNILDTGCAGGAFFALIDEWWKRTWIVDELAFPRERYRLWHNVTSPEQNFGLIAFELPPPDFTRGPTTAGAGRIRQVASAADAEFFHVRLMFDRALSADDDLVIGFDTYGDAVGESILPSGVVSARRHEFALVFTPPERAELYVTEAYDLFGIWHGLSSEAQRYRSIASDAGAWNQVRWRNYRAPRATGEPGASEVDEIGQLRVRPHGASNSTSEAILVEGATIHVRVPWTLLHFADPSTKTVIADDRTTPVRETEVSEGIALTVQLGGELLETPRFRWEGWSEAPNTTERLKASAELFARTLRGI